MLTVTNLGVCLQRLVTPSMTIPFVVIINTKKCIPYMTLGDDKCADDKCCICCRKLFCTCPYNKNVILSYSRYIYLKAARYCSSGQILFYMYVDMYAYGYGYVYTQACLRLYYSVTVGASACCRVRVRVRA